MDKTRSAKPPPLVARSFDSRDLEAQQVSSRPHRSQRQRLAFEPAIELSGLARRGAAPLRPDGLASYATSHVSRRLRVVDEMSTDPLELQQAAELPVGGASELLLARQTLEHRLADMAFSAKVTAERLGEQVQMESEYLDWAAEHFLARTKEFGDHSYSLDMAHPPSLLSDASLPIAFSVVTAGLKSSFRSPFKSAVAARLDKELTHNYDKSVLSGMASGLPALLVSEVINPALKSRAKVHNLPTLEPVKLKVLFPDLGPVILRVAIEGGELKKLFLRPIEAHERARDIAERGALDHPTRQELVAELEKRRDRLKLWQDSLEGLRGGMLSKPFMAGSISALRRYLSSEQMLLAPFGVLGGTMTSSFSASALTELGQSVAKVVPRVSAVSIDNLVGGTQRVHSFKLQRPKTDEPAAGWSDIGGAPYYLVDALREMAALASHSVIPDRRAVTPANQRSDWNIYDTAKKLLGIATANVFAAVTGDSVGPYFAQIVRGQGEIPGLSESPRSLGNIFQQFASSGMNELTWGALSGEYGFGDLTPPHARTLADFRKRMVDVRKQIMSRNEIVIAGLRSEIQSPDLNGITEAVDLFRKMRHLNRLVADNEKLLANIRDVTDWVNKTPAERAQARERRSAGS